MNAFPAFLGRILNGPRKWRRPYEYVFLSFVRASPLLSNPDNLPAARLEVTDCGESAVQAWAMGKLRAKPKKKWLSKS